MPPKLTMSNTVIIHKTSDVELINMLKASGIDKKNAEEQLFNAYSYFIKEGQRKYKLSHDEVFDAYADAMLAVIEKIRNDAFKGLSSIKTYLYQIFHNKCVDFLRKKTTNKQSVHQTASISESMFQLSDSAKSIINKLMEKTDFDLLKQKLNELGDNCRQLLLLWADGYSDKEIVGKLTYKTADVVKTTRLRCMDKLRLLYNTKLY
ncbi:MAG TPA: sigma-70 family RNA polymerase sigma factor [Puia sp.]|nr:sigma-70 family RNA polymerase sigma factor [Puia sp.]